MDHYWLYVQNCKIFEKRCTAKNIRDLISDISDKIEKNFNRNIAAECTDNVANIIKAFLGEDNIENNNNKEDDLNDNYNIIEENDLEEYNNEKVKMVNSSR